MYSPAVALLVRRREEGVDPFGAPCGGWGEPEEVPGCLFAPGAPEGLGEGRPEGARIDATAHFPRGYAGALRGAQVSADGSRWLSVVGDPVPYPPGAIRGPWGTYALLTGTEG